MTAVFVESGADQSSLIHRVLIDRPLRGREIVEPGDPIARAVFDWVDDSQNGADGVHGLVNVETRLGEGIFYTWGFSDAPTAARFRATFEPPAPLSEAA